jgi:uncharacterized cupin superfamily protein
VDHLSCAVFQTAALTNVAASHDAGDMTPTQQTTIHFSNVEREPKHEVTDPSLYKQGMVSHGIIRATPGETEYLDAGW